MIEYDIALERLQKHCPLAEPFVITEITREEGIGYFGRHKDYFELLIATDVEEIIQVDSLIHEWAHALRAVKSPHGQHDSLFGIELARCLRAVYGDTSDDDDIKARLPTCCSVIIFAADEKYGIPELRIENN